MSDFIGKDDSGRGIVNILAADKLMASPKLYATFLLWLLSELFEQLPEIGDPDKRSEEHTSELQSLMRISYAVFCLKKKTQSSTNITTHINKRIQKHTEQQHT